MDADIGAAVRALVEEGKGESIGRAKFFPLVTLDSGQRVGLDENARFALASEESSELEPFAAEEAYRFHEVCEWKRAKFDDALEDGARAQGLPPLPVSLAFPAVEVVRAVLAKNMHYTTRLALAWLHPSEIRDAQDEIRRVAADRQLPTALREFAERLVVSS